MYRVRASGQLYVRPIQGPLNLVRKLLQSNLSPWRLRGRKFRMWYSPDLIRQPRTLHTVRLSGGRETGAHARRHSRVIRPWRGEWQSSSFSLLIFHFIIIIITVISNPDNKTWQYILLPKLNHQRAQHSQRLGQIAVEWVGQQLGDAMQIVVKYAYNNIVLIIFVITSKGKRAFKWERCNSNKDVLYRSGPWQSSTVTVALYCWVKCEFTERPPDDGGTDRRGDQRDPQEVLIGHRMECTTDRTFAVADGWRVCGWQNKGHPDNWIRRHIGPWLGWDRMGSIWKHCY